MNKFIKNINLNKYIPDNIILFLCKRILLKKIKKINNTRVFRADCFYHNNEYRFVICFVDYTFETFNINKFYCKPHLTLKIMKFIETELNKNKKANFYKSKI